MLVLVIAQNDWLRSLRASLLIEGVVHRLQRVRFRVCVVYHELVQKSQEVRQIHIDKRL